MRVYQLNERLRHTNLLKEVLVWISSITLYMLHSLNSHIAVTVGMQPP